MKISLTVLATALAIVHGQACAADEGAKWLTAAELGAITTSGNTEGTSLTGKIDAHQELPDWSNQYIVTAYFKEDDSTAKDGTRTSKRSAERYSLSAKAAFEERRLCREVETSGTGTVGTCHTKTPLNTEYSLRQKY